MHVRWKQVGLNPLSVLAVWLAYFVYMVLAPKFSPGSIAEIIGLGALLLLLYLAAVKWVECRRPAELALAGAGRELGAGALAGLALFSLVIAILWIYPGAYQMQGWGGSKALGLTVMVVFWLAVAIEEEILWRGLIYRFGAKVFGTWGALLFSGALFSAKHMMDTPNVTFADFVGVLLGGLMLGAAYAATGRLWMPIGLHFGWNFAEGTLYGTGVSGNGVGASVITGKLVGPALWTGGEFGPEASAGAWIVLIAATAYLLWHTMKSKRIEPPIGVMPPQSPSTQSERNIPSVVCRSA